MNQLFEIIDINNSTIIVIGKTYCGIDYYISELEIELDRRQFRGEIIFDLLLANGLFNQNRFIQSYYFGNKIINFEVLNIKSIKLEYKRYVNNYYLKNLDILDNGILRTKDIETLKRKLLSLDLEF
jgi:hypothetical protein